MNDNRFTFSFIEQEVRNRTFGILTTINPDGTPQTTGILYGVSSPSSSFALYLVTSKKYRKVKNIERNPKVSFIIPFPHYLFRFVPSGTVTFNGHAEILPFDTEEVLEIFNQKRILRFVISDSPPEERGDYVIIKITPNPRVLCFGVGFKLLEFRRKHMVAGYTVTIPNDRFS